jgi:hypothetical protein
MNPNDHNQIVNVLNLYAFAVDTLCWDLFDRVFTPDIQADYYPGSKISGLETMKKEFALAHTDLDASQHTVGNHQVIVNGDRANALSYVIARLIRNVPEGGGSHWDFGGWYDDCLIRTGSGWRIQQRVCRGNWWEGNPRVAEVVPGAVFRPDVTLLRRYAQAGESAYLKAVRAQPL